MIAPPEDVEIIDPSDYKDLVRLFKQMPEVATPLLRGATAVSSKIERALYTAPAFIDAVKAAVPDVTLQAVLTGEQRRQIAQGALKLMTRKDGSLLANLIDPKKGKIVATIPLKSVRMAPEITQAMTNFSSQMQMAQIAEQIQAVQLAVEEVHMGQEHDRLATAYSCQQKLLQAMEIQDPELRSMALIQLAASAEDSRNLLMLSQGQDERDARKPVRCKYGLARRDHGISRAWRARGGKKKPHILCGLYRWDLSV